MIKIQNSYFDQSVYIIVRVIAVTDIVKNVGIYFLSIDDFYVVILLVISRFCMCSIHSGN
jgi:hypothetical protein